jgi:hypothetical protein
MGVCRNDAPGILENGRPAALRVRWAAERQLAAAREIEGAADQA